MFAQPQIVRKALEQVGRLVPGQLPVGGLNARDAYSMMPPTDAIDLMNVLVDSYGLSFRKGYQEFAKNLPGNMEVPTLMSYYPANAGASFPTPQKTATKASTVVVNGILFACTNKKIYDITGGGDGPWTPTDDIGLVSSDFWTWRNFQNAGGNFLVACNDNGAYITFGGAGFSDGFSSGFATQAVGFSRITEGPLPGQIQNINPDLFVYVMVWKRRLWFIEKDSSRAWYLPVEQVTGEAQMWDFGPSFRHGGYLVALANWTLDGGEGLDDYLVAFGSEGDVVIYKGYDPNQAATDPSAFQLHGIWYIGALPAGRRQVDPYGGDVYALSIQGMTQISKLVALSQLEANNEKDISDKVDPLITRVMQQRSEDLGWYVKILPREEMAVIGAPEELTGQGVQQLAYKVPQKAWSRLQDLPFACFTNHDALIFAGGKISGRINAAGRVFLAFQSDLDFIPLDVADGFGSVIRTRVIPAYQPLGTPGMSKRFTMIRPSYLASETPTLNFRVMVDFSGPGYLLQPTLPKGESSLWNVDVWNVAKWSGSPRPIRKWLGAIGNGYAATAQFDAIGFGRTRMTGLDWWVVEGGPL